MKHAETPASRRRGVGRKRYAHPKLKVYGDIRALTRNKKGATNDGTGKPRTRRSILSA